MESVLFDQLVMERGTVGEKGYSSTTQTNSEGITTVQLKWHNAIPSVRSSAVVTA